MMKTELKSVKSKIGYEGIYTRQCGDEMIKEFGYNDFVSMGEQIWWSLSKWDLQNHYDEQLKFLGITSED